MKGSRTVFGLAAVGRTTVQSLSPSGAAADATALTHPDLSADGRWVAFGSRARNLTPTPPDCGYAPECDSLYVRDRLSGTTTLIATSGSGGDKNDSKLHALASGPSLSADGRYIGFTAFPCPDCPGDPGYQGGPSDADWPNANAYLYDRLTGRVELVSRDSAGQAARRDPVINGGPLGGSGWPSVSPGGRYVVFTSDATNLGGPPPSPAQAYNVYRRDRVTGTTRVVSTDESGRPMHGTSCALQGRNISADGRFVAWEYVPGPVTPATGHPRPSSRIYLWDATTGRSLLVSKLPPGAQRYGSYCPTISLDGGHVGLVSRDALVPEDTNGTPDVYVYEVATGRMKRISVTSAGKQTIDPSYTDEDGERAVTLSADGRYAAFDSAAPGMTPTAVGSTSHRPGIKQIYVHDLLNGATVLASVSSTGEPLAGESKLPYISPDGRSVAFMNTGTSGPANVMVHELR